MDKLMTHLQKLGEGLGLLPNRIVFYCSPQP